MKSALALALILATGAFAQAKPQDDPACSGIVKQCEAAGFTVGGHKKTGKGVWADCVHQIATGKTVAGVTATETEAKACQEVAKTARKERKHKKE